MADDQLISVFAMKRDPRLRKLFSAIGITLDEGDHLVVEDRLYDVMLDIAPEFLPPDDSDGKEFRAEWRAMIEEALRG